MFKYIYLFILNVYTFQAERAKKNFLDRNHPDKKFIVFYKSLIFDFLSSFLKRNENY